MTSREPSFYYEEKKQYFSEFKRQIFHIIYGLLIIILSLYFQAKIMGFFLSAMVFLGGVIILLHKRNSFSFIHFFLKYFERPDVIMVFPGKGLFFYTFGCASTLLLFPSNIALASIAILAIGDSTSHLLGAYIKKNRYNSVEKKKMVEGMLFGIICGSIAATFFVDPLFGFVASTISMVIEYIEFKEFHIDDNFYVPMIASLVLSLLKIFF